MEIEGRGGSAERKRRLRPTWYGAGMLLIGVVSAALLFVVAPPAEVLSEIGHMSLPWLAAAVVLELCSCLSYLIVFRHFFPEPSRRDSRRVAWIALGTGAVLPGGFISSPPGARHGFRCAGGRAKVLNFHTPHGGFIEGIRRFSTRAG